MQLQASISALDRLEEVEITEEENLEGLEPEANIEKISLENVSFAYGYRENTLDNINMEINKREKVAIVGPSGSGKTTLIKLIMRFYPVETNSIFINDISIDKISKKWLRTKISYLSQSVFFFRGTIRENMMLGNSYISDSEIIEMLMKVDLLDMLNKLPNGLDTVIEEGAVNFSEGQKQRLALCRAMLSKPEVIILDEATSHLDSITEKRINDLFQEISDSITIITIAHRLSSIINSDRIYFIEDGCVKSSGTHEDLLLKNSTYSKMVENLAF